MYWVGSFVCSEAGSFWGWRSGGIEGAWNGGCFEAAGFLQGGGVADQVPGDVVVPLGVPQGGEPIAGGGSGWVCGVGQFMEPGNVVLLQQ